jgi:GT2 family glycosyltransferase
MVANSPTVGLALVTKDRFSDTVETILQLDIAAFDEAVIVDDSEDDRLRAWASNHEIAYVDGPGVNMQAARNVAIKELTTDIITFIDDDVYCPSNFADRIRNGFKNEPNLVALGGPCPSVRPKPDRGVCNFSSLTISKTGTIYGDASKLIPDEPIEVDTLRGANMSFRREILEEIGGFDTEYGGHSQREETDVCVRFSEFGRIRYDPDLRCYHKEQGNEFNEELFNWRFRNHARFVRKNFGLTAGLLGFFGLFLRLCGSPESIYQLLFEKFVLHRDLSITGCLGSYLRGLELLQVDS